MITFTLLITSDAIPICHCCGDLGDFLREGVQKSLSSVGEMSLCDTCCFETFESHLGSPPFDGADEDPCDMARLIETTCRQTKANGGSSEEEFEIHRNGHLKPESGSAIPQVGSPSHVYAVVYEITTTLKNH